MTHNIDNKNFKYKRAIKEEYEDTTKYGEFISSYFAWIEPDKQREIVERMQNITDRSK